MKLLAQRRRIRKKGLLVCGYEWKKREANDEMVKRQRKKEEAFNKFSGVKQGFQ